MAGGLKQGLASPRVIILKKIKVNEKSVCEGYPTSCRKIWVCLTIDPSQRISALLQEYLKGVCLFLVLCPAPVALAGQLDPLDACGALAASADQPTVVEEIVKKLSGGYSVAQAVAKCNENKELCQRVQKDLRSRKVVVPKGLTCSK